MYAYAHTPLDEETGDKLFALYEAFMISKVFLTSLQNKCYPSSKHLLTKILHWYITPF